MVLRNLQGSGRLLEKPHATYDSTQLCHRTKCWYRSLFGSSWTACPNERGPIILTGYSTLNKLLARDVTLRRTSWVGLRSCSPMVCCTKALKTTSRVPPSKCLSFVPRMLVLSRAESADPVDRPVAAPTTTPYDPYTLAGTSDMPGFFDKDSYKGYLGGWGRGVIVGRGRLGSPIQLLKRGPLDASTVSDKTKR
jgi:acetyl-CoA carboxylase/biotin carboxylase 1